MLSYLAPALAALGAEVTVLTAWPPGLHGLEVAGAARLSVERLATAQVRFLGTWLYMRNLARWFETHPVDLAYVSMLKHDAYVAVGAGARRGFPVVLRPEGAGATGDLAWQSWGRFGRAIGRRCRQADAVVSISEAITAELKQAGYESERIHDLPNGVPVPNDAWQPRPDWRAAPHAVFVGRLAAEKGLDTLVEAWAEVRKTHSGATLTLIGEGPERPALESRVAALGLNGAVVLPGASANPNALLRAADLFVLPSREEGMSIALLEAMALGMPLVASSVPGNRRLVHDGVHGRLVAPNDSDALARAMIDLWANLDRAIAMGRAARDEVARGYSVEAVARRHMELFKGLIDARSRRTDN
jgi:glycosyltransferase involved in cell wall biosynthesis